MRGMENPLLHFQGVVSSQQSYAVKSYEVGSPLLACFILLQRLNLSKS